MQEDQNQNSTEVVASEANHDSHSDATSISGTPHRSNLRGRWKRTRGKGNAVQNSSTSNTPKEISVDTMSVLTEKPARKNQENRNSARKNGNKEELSCERKCDYRNLYSEEASSENLTECCFCRKIIGFFCRLFGLKCANKKQCRKVNACSATSNETHSRNRSRRYGPHTRNLNNKRRRSQASEQN